MHVRPNVKLIKVLYTIVLYCIVLIFDNSAINTI